MKDWETTLAAALQRQWKRYRRALKSCQQRFSEKSVHASRVESRRLLAQLELLGIFAPARLFKRARRALKRHHDTFDPLRDTHVQLALLETHSDAFPETKALCDFLRRRERNCLKQAAHGIRNVKTGRLKKVIAKLVRQLKASRRDGEHQVRARKAIMRAVETAFARVVERRRHMDPGQVASIHRTRVAFKKFRYMVEALQPLFREISGERLRAMQAFQTVLGHLQDTDVFLTRMDKFIHKDSKRAEALAVFRHWLLQRRTAQIQHCMDRADIIFDFWPLLNSRRGSGRMKPSAPRPGR
jgi:CHAD domain-containing protein